MSGRFWSPTRKALGRDGKLRVVSAGRLCSTALIVQRPARDFATPKEEKRFLQSQRPESTDKRVHHCKEKRIRNCSSDGRKR